MNIERNKNTNMNAQPITGGIFYCRFSAGFSVSAFNKLSCNLAGQYYEINNKKAQPLLAVSVKSKKTSFNNGTNNLGIPCGTY